MYKKKTIQIVEEAVGFVVEYKKRKEKKRKERKWNEMKLKLTWGGTWKGSEVLYFSM